MKTGILLLALGVFSLAPMALRAQTFAEGKDAGITEATAAVVPPGITKITGTYKPGTDGPFGPNPADIDVGSSRVDLQACKLEYSIVSPK